MRKTLRSLYCTESFEAESLLLLLLFRQTNQPIEPKPKKKRKLSSFYTRIAHFTETPVIYAKFWGVMLLRQPTFVVLLYLVVTLGGSATSDGNLHSNEPSYRAQQLSSTRYSF